MTISSDRKFLRAKTRRVAVSLERSLGIPRQKFPLPPPLDMLIATILSQNTNDKNSHTAYTSLRKRFPAWTLVAEGSSRGVVAAIRMGGMANQKGARIQKVLRDIRKRFGGYSLSALRGMGDDEVIELLTAFHGVGVKTASCVLLFSLGRDILPVDTHVHRLCTRLGLAPGSKTPEQTFDLMRGIVPKGKGYSFHTNLIRFGRRVCRSHRPSCGHCPLYSECIYEGKQQDTRPVVRRSSTDHDFMLLDNVRPQRRTAGGRS